MLSEDWESRGLQPVKSTASASDDLGKTGMNQFLGKDHLSCEGVNELSSVCPAVLSLGLQVVMRPSVTTTHGE